MKLLVTGDRDWHDQKVIGKTLLDFLESRNIDPKDVTVVHGAARGADSMADACARIFGMTPKPYPAHWKHTEECPINCHKITGKRAGIVRNQEMLSDNPDIEFAFAFHSNLQKSKGTKDMVTRLQRANILYIHIS